MADENKHEDEPLREEDVTRGDKLDDEISEGEELPEDADEE